jgi:hypothetical protein
VTLIDVPGQGVVQSALIGDDDVIETFSTSGSNESLGVRVGVSSRLHRERAMPHKPSGLSIPSIRCVAGHFS